VKKISWLAALVLLLAPVVVFGSKESKEAKTVDSGSYSIFLAGRKIGSETFSIEQRPEFSTATAEIKIEDGGNKAVQTSELKIATNGDLEGYRWRELSPGKAQTTVEYKDQFLVQQFTEKPGQKPQEHAFMLPPSTSVLDDNFFTHREILLWRYIASVCGGKVDSGGCRLERSQFGIFVPHQQTSAMVSLEYRGRERVTIHGSERELDHFALTSDGVEWGLWLDPSYKLQRIVVPSEKVEVVRD
jgi:hypothetical protein